MSNTYFYVLKLSYLNTYVLKVFYVLKVSLLEKNQSFM